VAPYDLKLFAPWKTLSIGSIHLPQPHKVAIAGQLGSVGNGTHVIGPVMYLSLHSRTRVGLSTWKALSTVSSFQLRQCHLSSAADRQASVSVLLTAAYGYLSAKVLVPLWRYRLNIPGSIHQRQHSRGTNLASFWQLMDIANVEYLYADLSAGDDDCGDGQSNEGFPYPPTLSSNHK